MHTHYHTASTMGGTNSRHYEINASTILSTANQFKNMTDLNHDNIKFQTLFQQFSLDIGRLDIKIKIVHSIRLFTLLLFFILASFGTILFDLSNNDKIVSEVIKVLKCIEFFLPEDVSYYVILIVNFIFLILYFSLFFFFLYITLQYKQHLCISLSETYAFIILSRTVVPIFTSYVSHLFTYSLYDLIFHDNIGQSVVLVIISAPLLIAQISFLFISCSAYNATPVIRKHDSTILWFSHSHFDFLFFIFTMVLVFVQTFFRFLSTNIASFIFAIISIAISVSLATYIIIRLPFVYPRTNSIFLSTFLSTPFCSISPILAYYFPSSIPYYLVCLLVLIIIFYFVGKLIINRRMVKILKRFEQDNFQVIFRGYSSSNEGLLGSFMHSNRENLDYNLMNIKGDHDLSLLTRIGFLYNEPNINNSNFIHFGLEMSNKADFVLSAIQVMLATQTNSIILTSLYQASLLIGKGPFNLNTFRTLFNLMRQEMLTQLNKPLIEAISIAKKSNHYLEITLSDFWGDVVKQKTETLLHLLPRITEESMKTELLFLRLARNYPLSPAVYREVVLFYYKTIGDYHKALKFQGMIDKAKNYQSNRQTFNGQQNNLALFSSFSSSSSHSSSLEFFDNANTDLNGLHEKLEPYLLAQDSIMSISFPPLFWMYATMVVVIVILLVLPAVILGVSMSDVRKFQTSFTPIETIGELKMIIARIAHLIRRRNLFEIDDIIYPPHDEIGEPDFIQFEFLTKESINESLYNYHQRLVDETDKLLNLCVPGSTLNKACSEKIHELRVSNSIVMASVFDLLSSFENSLVTILSDKEFDWKTAASSTPLLSILQNFDVLFTSLSSIIATLIDEINDFSQLTTIWFILIWAVPIVTILPLAITSGCLFMREVVFTLKLFFQIPKNEILNLKSNFRKKKHDNSKNRPSQTSQTVQTSNKKMLMSNASTSTISQTNETEIAGYDNHEDLADSLATVPKQISGLTGTFMIRLLIIVLFTCIMVTIGIVVFNQSNYQLINMSNAYASSINVYSSTFASYVWTQEIFAKKPLLFNISELKTKSYAYITEFVSKFNELLYGNSTADKGNTDFLPALLLGKDVIDSYLKSEILVYNESEKLYEPSYGVIHMVYITMSCESQMRLFTLNSQWLLDQNSQVSFTFKDMFVYHYEHILFSHLNSFLMDAVSLFDSKIHDLNESKTEQLVLVFVIVFMIDILFYSTFVVSSFITLLRHLKCPRYLLLLVPPEALLKSQSIVKWMTGIFDSSKRVHSSEMNKNAKKGIEVDFIVHYSDCGLILASSDLKIERVNKAFCQLFRKNENEVIGMNFITFLKKSLIEKDKRLFSWINKEVHKMLEGTSTNYKCQFDLPILDQNSKLIYITILIEGIQDFGTDEADIAAPAKLFSIIIIDQTIQHQLNEEIEKEKQITQSLYDQSFFEQMQKAKNENDCSFESPECTIMFTSIKNWDSLLSKKSTNSIEIMAFLNKLYSAYDEEIHRFPSLTKIKSIGNTYIVCGGLFSDPSYNTSQIVINYSLRILSIAKELSENNPSGKIDLDVTIGVNTGGPITCGVIGRIRPGFDIAGEAVEIASKMNSSDLPGFIQISESTYNNVKYLNYNLKERGEIQINEFDSKLAYLISEISASNVNQSFIKPAFSIPNVESLLKQSPSNPIDLKIANSESFPVESEQLGTMQNVIDDEQIENNQSNQNDHEPIDNTAAAEPDPVDNGQVKPID